MPASQPDGQRFDDLDWTDDESATGYPVQNDSDAIDAVDDDLLAAMAAAFGEDAVDLQLLDDDTTPESAPADETLSQLILRLDAAMAGLSSDASTSAAWDDSDRNRSATLPEVSAAAMQQRRGSQERFILFQTGGRTIAIPLSGTLEIERLPTHTRLPRTPNWMRGIANIRGEIVSITDLAALCGGAMTTPPIQQKIIVVHSERLDATTALAVDRVIGIRTFTDQIIPCPDDLSDPLASVCDRAARTDGGLILLVDPNALLNHPEMQPFMNAG